MADFGVITVIGRLTKDVELKNLGNSTVAKLSVACTTNFRDGAETMFYDVDIWGKRGETVSEHFKKGDTILVSGTPDQRTYQEKTYLEIKNADFSFLAGAKKDADQGGKEAGETKNAPKETASIDDISDDEIPF